MATINNIGTATVHSIRSVRPHVYKCGDGRRLRRLKQTNPNLVIPETAQIADCAEFEIDCSWIGFDVYDPEPTSNSPIVEDANGYCHKAKPPSNPDVSTTHSMVFFKDGKGTGRANGSKTILTPEAAVAYHILSWSDLFGKSIKESQLGRKGGVGNWVLYARKATIAELAEIQEALYIAGVAY